MHRLGLLERRHPLAAARWRAPRYALAGALGGVGLGFLVLAAYRGLALVMAPALAALSLGAALLLAAALAWLRAREPRPPRRHAAAPSGPDGDPAEAIGAAVADLVRRAEAGGPGGAVASLLAGFTLGARRGR